MSKRIVSALIVASFVIIVGRCSVSSKKPGVGRDTPSSNTIEFDIFADTDETISILHHLKVSLIHATPAH